jgi:hypothetical protein
MKYKPKLDPKTHENIVIPMVINKHYVAMYFDAHNLDTAIYLDSLDYEKETYINRRKKCYKLASALMKIWGFGKLKAKIDSRRIADQKDGILCGYYLALAIKHIA